jgi:DNA-binding SARP family transcriptional activator
MAEGHGYQLRLLGSWGLQRGERSLHLQLREQRVVAALGLWGPQSRAALAGMLWPESPEDRARSNLRTALLRARRELDGALFTRHDEVRLSEVVSVDVTLLRAILDMVESVPEEAAADPVSALRVLRAPDLLIGWYDEWVVEARDRLHQRRFRALERLARVSLDNGHPTDSVDFAVEAVRLEPLVESAVALHIRALLGDGDLSAALREYRRFRDRIRGELGVGPSRTLTELLLRAKAERSGVGAELVRDPRLG